MALLAAGNRAHYGRAMTETGLPDPKIELGADGTPRSGVSGDVYFSVEGGIAETRHVFLGGTVAPDVWRDAATVRIGELGFGTGLNFLVAWHDWSRTAPPGASLEYVAVEGYPPNRDVLSRALEPMDEVKREAEALIQAWPPRVPGLHRLTFDGGRVRLTLALGEAEEMLAKLSGAFDAWFLDGFAPAKNPDMWSPPVLAHVARLTRTGGRVATFTVAGEVRRGLETQGFAVEKRLGFGKKRECLSAVRTGDGTAMISALKPGARVAVIGAGIAGGTMARALAVRGLRPALIDPAPGAGASGNPAGLIAPRLPRQPTPQGRVMAQGYPYAVRFYDALASEGAPVWLGPRGAAALARNDDEDERQQRAVAAFGLPSDVMCRLSAAELSARLGAAVTSPGLWFPQAGTLSPEAVTKHLRSDAPVRRKKVAAFAPSENGWNVTFEGGGSLSVDAVVFCAGTGILDLLADRDWPVRANRGQLSYLRSQEVSPKHAVTFGGYLTPAVPVAGGEALILGATYARRDEVPADDWSKLRDEDHAENLAGLKEHFPVLGDADVIGGRTALRATVRDYLPLAGAIGDGTWILGGLGSRGFLTAPLLAECVADAMTGATPPLPPDLLAALDPNRFEKST